MTPEQRARKVDAVPFNPAIEKAIADAIREAVLAEREACAQSITDGNDCCNHTPQVAAQLLADRIRARPAP